MLSISLKDQSFRLGFVRERNGNKHGSKNAKYTGEK